MDWTLGGSRVTALLRALLGALAILLAGLMPVGASFPLTLLTLLGIWLCAASMICYAGLLRSAGAKVVGGSGQRPIPLRFSGALGRFEVRRRGDGRHVEIVADEGVRAEVRATDRGDEIVFHSRVEPNELEDFGAALGQAIEMACAGEEAHVEWDDHSADHDGRSDGPVLSRW